MLLKALHTIGSLDMRMGGSVKAVADLVRYEAAAGVDVTLAGTYDVGDDLAYLEPLETLGVEVCRFRRDTPKSRLGSRALSRWLVKTVDAFDLVEIHGVFTRTAFSAGAACRRSGTPYVVRPHGQLEPYDLAKHACLKQFISPILTRPLIRGAEALLLTSRMESDLARTYGLDSAKYVLPLPVHIDTLEEVTNDAARSSVEGRAHARACLGVDDGRTVVLFIGRIDVKKGLHFLVPAAEEVASEGHPLALIVAGDGDPEALRQLDEVLSGADRRLQVVRPGRVSGAMKHQVFVAADIFALPSLTENFGITIVEAMAYGLPLLVSRNVSMSPLIRDSAAGVLCETSVAGTKDGLEALLKRDLAVMGEASRDLFLSDFNPADVINQTKEVYGQILRRKSSGRA